MDLAQLFNHYGSDKDNNGYVQAYSTLFSHLKDKEISLLEIGIGTMIEGAPSSMLGYSLPGYKPGGSLRGWRDYFVNGRIIGMDIQPDTQFSDEPRIETYLCNSTSKSEVDAQMAKLGCKFDIIIDDGSHLDSDQWVTMQNCLPYVKEGGYYIIEDITPYSRVSNVPAITEVLAGGYPFFFVGVKNNLMILHKQKLQSTRKGY